MIIKKTYIVFILSLLLSSCQIIFNNKVHLKGNENELDWVSKSSNYSFNPYYHGFTHEPKYIDSLGNPYTGIVVKMLCKRKDSAIIENAHEIDSMCIYKGTRYGYSKLYGSLEEKEAIIITYTNILSHNEQSKRFPYCKYQINVAYNTSLNPKEVIKVDITVLKQNLKYTCEINYLKKKIMVKTKINRIGDELGLKYSTKMTDKVKFEEKNDIKKYFKLFPEIISQEILDRCKPLGIFDNRPVEDPIIKGNCNFD